MYDTSPKLPGRFQDKVASFPESSMGACSVTIVLVDGRSVLNVSVAWGETIVKIGDRMIENTGDLDFDLADISDVTPQI